MLELEYVRADNRLVRRTVSPQGLVLKGSIWYLVALAGRWDATFRVSRVRSAAVIDESATQIPDFDLTAYWERSVAEVTSERAKGQVTVHLRADRTAADELPWVLGEATRHQVVSAAEEDGEALDLEVSFDSIDDACRTLLSLGGSVEVLDPPQLREHLVRGAHALIARYEVTERRPPGATRD
jgi:predicted DNA-binding transcriptional regulator YafY